MEHKSIAKRGLGKRPAKDQERPCACYDCTIRATGTTMEHWLEQKKTIVKDLKKWAKRWSMQLEKGEEEGYMHFQLRFSLIKKDRLQTLANKLKDTGLKGHLSLTSSANIGNWDYTDKAATRQLGPWKWDDKEEKEKPADLIGRNLRRWQSEVETIALGKPHPRWIYILLDTQGGSGKSWFCKYMHWEHKAIICPPFEDTTRLMGWCAKIWKESESNIFLIDMPRGMKETRKTQELWSALETLKGGIAYDWRHTSELVVKAPPHLFVFCNQKPNHKYLSLDRWKYINTAIAEDDNDPSEKDLDMLWTIAEEEIGKEHKDSDMEQKDMDE